MFSGIQDGAQSSRSRSCLQSCRICLTNCYLLVAIINFIISSVQTRPADSSPRRRFPEVFLHHNNPATGAPLSELENDLGQDLLEGDDDGFDEDLQLSPHLDPKIFDIQWNFLQRQSNCTASPLTTPEADPIMDWDSEKVSPALENFNATLLYALAALCCAAYAFYLWWFGQEYGLRRIQDETNAEFQRQGAKPVVAPFIEEYMRSEVIASNTYQEEVPPDPADAAERGSATRSLDHSSGQQRSTSSAARLKAEKSSSTTSSKASNRRRVRRTTRQTSLTLVPPDPNGSEIEQSILVQGSGSGSGSAKPDRRDVSNSSRDGSIKIPAEKVSKASKTPSKKKSLSDPKPSKAAKTVRPSQSSGPGPGKGDPAKSAKQQTTATSKMAASKSLTLSKMAAAKRVKTPSKKSSKSTLPAAAAKRSSSGSTSGYYFDNDSETSLH